MTLSKDILIDFEGKLRKKQLYLCNQAVGTEKEKMAYHWRNVTCKNCLRGIEK